MDQKLMNMLESACDELGYSKKVMSSGAGHDAMNMAKLGKVGMLFIPCRGGRSHCPEEYASPEDMEKGVDVLERCLYHLLYEDALNLL